MPEDRIVKPEFPSNSHRAREEKREPKGEPKKPDKVIKGKVVTRKKPFGKRLIETFVGDDVNNVGSYVLYDVLIPAARSMMSEMFHGSIEMIFGEVSRRGGSNTRREGGKSYVSYNNYSSNKRDDRREISNKGRSSHKFDEIILESRGEAEEVLSNLVDLTIDYGQATVSDLYGFVGIAPSFTDEKYGWTDLRTANVSRVRDGYLINLPKTIVLD